MPTLRCGVTIRSVGYSGIKGTLARERLCCNIIDELEALHLGGSVGAAASPIYFMSASST